MEPGPIDGAWNKHSGRHGERRDSCQLMIVHGDQAIRRTVETLTVLVGCRALSAPSVAEAVPLLQRWRPDLLLLDGEAPFGEIRISIRTLREAARWAAPVVLLGAESSPTEGIFEILVADYLPKPFDARELFAIVQRYVWGRA